MISSEYYFQVPVREVTQKSYMEFSKQSHPLGSGPQGGDRQESLDWRECSLEGGGYGML